MKHDSMYIERAVALDVIGEAALHQIRRCYEVARHKYMSTIHPEMPRAGASLTAQILRGLVIEQARHRFGDLSHVHVHEPGPNPDDRRFLLRFQGESDGLILQFKKVKRLGNGRLMTNNYPTPTATTFDQQELGGGTPPFPRVTAGWLAPPVGTVSYAGLFLCCIVSRRGAAWEHDLVTGDHNLTLNFSPPEGDLSAADLERRQAAWRERRGA